VAAQAQYGSRILTVTSLEQRGVGFRSLQESFDTTTNGGRLIYHIFAALAEFERGIIQERTRAGLASARARGRKGGRPRALTAKQIATARRLLEDPNQTVTEVTAVLGVSRSTIYRALQETPAAAERGESHEPRRGVSRTRDA
jgi:DNA invertase Pin-like site-specific DNA recombinase